MSCSTSGCGCLSAGGAGCNKLNIFDWLSDIPTPKEDNRYVEVAFEDGSRREFFINDQGTDFHIGDRVAVESSNLGYEIGQLVLKGYLALANIKKAKIDIHDSTVKFKKVLHRATKKELEKHEEAKSKEQDFLIKARKITKQNNLNMKISKVEIQSDFKKITFYYIADGRIDFRELIKQYAISFKSKVEMKQISNRKEASLTGGIGSCGRELCCSSWLSPTQSVNTSAARYQELSINTAKLNGQCGKLKCCLNYELDMYIEAASKFPKNAQKIYADEGYLKFIKKDVFKRWMIYETPKSHTHIALKVEDVKYFLSQKAPLDKLVKANQFNQIENKTKQQSKSALHW